MMLPMIQHLLRRTYLFVTVGFVSKTERNCVLVFAVFVNTTDQLATVGDMTNPESYVYRIIEGARATLCMNLCTLKLVYNHILHCRPSQNTTAHALSTA